MAATLLTIENFASAYLETSRDIRICLPCGYSAAAECRYPVLYVHDGQNLFTDARAYSGQSWQLHRVVDELIQAGRIDPIVLVAIDHAGPFGHREYADHITQALNQHGIDCAHYWATHTGTAAGLLIAAECPDRFRSLILEGPVLPGRNVPSVTAEVARVRKIAAEEGIDAAISSWWSNAPWFKHMRANPEACRAEQHKAVIESFSGRPWLDDQTARAVPDVTENLANTEIRTLIYNGEFDHPEFLAEASHLSNLLPAARCEIVANAGGFPSWEQPHATNRMVSEFLGTVA